MRPVLIWRRDATVLFVDRWGQACIPAHFAWLENKNAGMQA
jgi:hypothetical protein